VTVTALNNDDARVSADENDRLDVSDDPAEQCLTVDHHAADGDRVRHGRVGGRAHSKTVAAVAACSAWRWSALVVTYLSAGRTFAVRTECSRGRSADGMSDAGAKPDEMLRPS